MRNFCGIVILLAGIFTLSCKTRPISDSVDFSSMERSQIGDQYKWNLHDLYPNDEGWEISIQEAEKRIPEIGLNKGKLAESSSNLYQTLDMLFDLYKTLEKAQMYASMLYDQDTRQTLPASMTARTEQLFTLLNSSAAFIEPEIIQIPDQTVKAFFITEPKLNKYSVYIQNIKRLAPHTLNPGEESILARAGSITGIAENANSILSSAEIPYKTITLSDGSEVLINEAGYGNFRYSANRDDRMKVFDAFYNALKSYRLTKATLLNGKIKENIFYAQARKYDNTLQANLYPNQIPEAVYLTLIKNVKVNLPSLQRYLVIRKKMLGLDTLNYFDFYPSMLPLSNAKYSFEQGQVLILDALKVFGVEYKTKLQDAFSQQWIDVYPNAGKSSGAYCNAAYGFHPLLLINYNNKFDDVCMTAHELGHAMHSYYSNKTQPFALSGYSSFVAEVASTCNEALVMEAALKTITDPSERLSILCNYAESFRTTLFRQTLFAEFEYLINKKSEEGQSLSADDFDSLYLSLLREYYGHDKGISKIDSLYAHEWEYISHFYLGFYNFQYSTSYTTSIAVSSKILTEGQPMVDKYISFLSSGCTGPPLELLNTLGVDMTTNEPFDIAMKKFNAILDEIEKLSGK